MYCIGGRGTSSVYRLNLTDRYMKWNKVASINKWRSFHAGAVFRGCIVISGGVIDGGDSTLTEIYETNTNKWRFL